MSFYRRIIFFLEFFVISIGQVVNFFAFYSTYKRLKSPLELDYETRKETGIGRNLELPPPGIIPLSKQIYRKLVEIIEMKSNC